MNGFVCITMAKVSTADIIHWLLAAALPRQKVISLFCEHIYIAMFVLFPV